ncbi:sensor histidine kinase [Chitinophaga niabensis]|uniref:sensor histidine kinase n=1 Tax=Chitinophaga niabensis TaxID=536979 RepID=UPI0031BA917A
MKHIPLLLLLCWLPQDLSAQTVDSLFFVKWRFYAQRAEGIKTSDKLTQARGSLELGSFFLLDGAADSCLFYGLEALSLAESIGNDSIASAASQLIGNQYKLQKKYPRAHYYMNMGINYSRKTQYESLQLHALGNKSMLYNWENKPDSAIPLQLQILSVFEKQKDTLGITKVHMVLAGCYSTKKDTATARKHLVLFEAGLRAKKYRRQLTCDLMMVAGILHWELRDTSLAEDYLKKAIPIARSMDSKYMLQRAYDTLHAIEVKKKDFKQALAYRDTAYQFRDSIASEKSIRHAQQLEIQFRTAQKDKELAENKLALKQQNLLIAILGILVLLGLIVYGYFRHKQQLLKGKLMNLRQENKLGLMEAAIQGEERERARIAKDLHDGLAGMLAAVKMHFESLQYDHPALKDSADFEQVNLLLNNASGEVRKTAHNLMPEMLAESGLYEALRKYCNSISISRFRIDYYTIGDLTRFPPNFEISVYRIVQELLHNIVKHAQATYAMVQLSQTKETLTVTVEDNGVGMDGQTNGDGMGMESLRNRVAAMNGTICWEKNQRDETSVYIEFNLKIITHAGN